MLPAPTEAFCPRLAGAGFVTFAPDLCRDEGAIEIAEAEALVSTLCHWPFAEGLMDVAGRYRLLVSPQLQQEPNRPGHHTNVQTFQRVNVPTFQRSNVPTC